MSEPSPSSSRITNILTACTPLVIAVLGTIIVVADLVLNKSISTATSNIALSAFAGAAGLAEPFRQHQKND